MICTFFGHRDAPVKIEDKLRRVLLDLTKNNDGNIFYVGNQGSFDFTVKKILKELKAKYYIVLAYMPTKIYPLDIFDYSETIIPKG
ncbi:MAG: hypothetical protein IKV36_04425 [Clostridia bacterium]|nr:hypothetical protein [Clostridia bacterium]